MLKLGQAMSAVGVLICSAIEIDGLVASETGQNGATSQRHATHCLRSPVSQKTSHMLIGHQMVFFWTQRYTLQNPLLAKRLLVVGQAIPVTDTRVLDAVHSLPQTVRADGNLLHPRLDALVRSQLQHLQRLASAAQVRATNEAAVGQEVLVADGDAAASRKTDGNPLAVDVEQTEVGREVEALKGVGRVEDEVERHLVRLVPALLAGGEVAVGAHLEGVGLL